MARRFRYAAKRPTPGELLVTVRRCNRASIDFLKTDLETALTVCAIATESGDKSRSDRVRRHARTAYDTVVRMMRRVELKPPDAEFLARKLKRLKEDLAGLGEKFS